MSIADVDKEQLRKGLAALLKHVKTLLSTTPAKKQLFTESQTEALDQQPIYLQLTTKHTLTDNASAVTKPQAIPLPHSPYPPTATALVITKDPHDTYQKKVKGHPRVQQLVGLGALRKTFQSYEQLRRLKVGDVVGEEPALVLADESIVPSLPRTLGKAFYAKGKSTPIPVRMTPSTIQNVVEEAFGKTYFRKNQGNCVVIRVGYAGMSVDELVENCVAVWDRCVEGKRLVKNGIDGMRGAFVKSSTSVALPVWASDELFSAEDVLADGVAEERKAEKVKSKAKRKLLTSTAENLAEEDETTVDKEKLLETKTGKKRTRADAMERAFEYKRAKKLAKLDKSSREKTKKIIKA